MENLVLFALVFYVTLIAIPSMLEGKFSAQ